MADTKDNELRDETRRFELAREATHEISMLAEATAKLCNNDDFPIYHGIMARITVLSQIVYQALRLHGDPDHEWGEMAELTTLERAFKGYI